MKTVSIWKLAIHRGTRQLLHVIEGVQSTLLSPAWVNGENHPAPNTEEDHGAKAGQS